MAGKKEKLSRSTVIEALKEMLADATTEEENARDEMTTAFESGRKRGLSYAIRLLS